MGFYCIFIALVRKEKITWSYGSVLYVHLYPVGAKLQEDGLVGKET